ncbi:GNAT family N-acetyltransferase [Peredibacter starrii]|uniref:GNAT family N-acetyltransferase n=1 Tax=Peredibacter starrii TaxID=28202 RepID=A0AAX4HMP4_9BACT|nr:GNAT family N-acetyltransferase [Peredibacter starrii]WPU64544.1 GNAT family N-acetyltransferase [Peredibacter starrii]
METRNYFVRRAQHSDAQPIIDSHDRSIREICSKDYTQEQIDAWSARKLKTEHWCQTIDRDFVWVVELDSEVRGFGHLAKMDDEVAEVMGLYFTPELLGLGAGKELFRVLITEAKSLKIKRLQLLATITAKSFYEKFGFKQIEGRCSIEMRGVDIPCFPMESIL